MPRCARYVTVGLYYTWLYLWFTAFYRLSGQRTNCALWLTSYLQLSLHGPWDRRSDTWHTRPVKYKCCTASVVADAASTACLISNDTIDCMQWLTSTGPWTSSCSIYKMSGTGRCMSSLQAKVHMLSHRAVSWHQLATHSPLCGSGGVPV